MLNNKLFKLISIKVYGAVVAYLTILLIPDLYNEEDSSVLILSMAMMVFSGVLFIFGQNVSIFKTGISKAEGGRQIYLLSIMVAILITIAGVSTLMMSAGVDLKSDTALLTYLLCCAYVCSELISIFLRNEGRFITSLLPREVLWRSLCLLYMFSGYAVTLNNTLVFFSYSLLLVLVFQAFILFRGGRAEKYGYALYFNHIKISFIAFLITLTSVLNMQAITFLTAYAYDKETASAFFLAERTSNLLMFVLTASGLYYGPKLIKSSMLDVQQLILDRAVLVGAISSLFFLFCFIAFYQFGCFGLQGVCAVDLDLFMLVFLAQLPNMLTGLVAFALQGLGSSKKYLKLVFISSIFTFSLQLLFSNYYSVYVVVILSFFASVLVNLLAVRILWVNHSLRSDVFNLLKC